MIEAIAIAAFLFVAIVVFGWRAFDSLDRARRAAASSNAARPVAYTGPLYTPHGREIRA